MTEEIISIKRVSSPEEHKLAAEGVLEDLTRTIPDNAKLFGPYCSTILGGKKEYDFRILLHTTSGSIMVTCDFGKPTEVRIIKEPPVYATVDEIDRFLQ